MHVHPEWWGLFVEAMFCFSKTVGVVQVVACELVAEFTAVGGRVFTLHEGYGCCCFRCGCVADDKVVPEFVDVSGGFVLLAFVQGFFDVVLLHGVFDGF